MKRKDVDIICAQGGEGGGHTGDTPFSVLIPAVVDLVKKSGAKSPLTGEPVQVVAAGGIADGRGLAVSLSYVHCTSQRGRLTSTQIWSFRCMGWDTLCRLRRGWGSS